MLVMAVFFLLLLVWTSLERCSAYIVNPRVMINDHFKSTSKSARSAVDISEPVDIYPNTGKRIPEPSHRHFNANDDRARSNKEKIKQLDRILAQCKALAANTPSTMRETFQMSKVTLAEVS